MVLIAPFSSVNESTWEHMKILFFPLFLFAIVQYFFFSDRADFWCIKLRGTALGLVLIPVLFYTYNGAIAKSPDWLNIVIFFVSAASVYLYEYYLFEKREPVCRLGKICFYIFLVIGLMFVIFTFNTPHLEIFRDPITQNFGI